MYPDVPCRNSGVSIVKRNDYLPRSLGLAFETTVSIRDELEKVIEVTARRRLVASAMSTLAS